MAIALLALLFCALVMLTISTAFVQFEFFQIFLLQLFDTEYAAFLMILEMASVTLALFAVVMTMFYLIGTGKAVKEGIKEHQLDPSYYDITLRCKRKFFPTMTFSLVFYIALPCVGVATNLEYLSFIWHILLSYTTLGIHGFICYQACIYLIENEKLVATVHRLIQEKELKKKRGE